MLTGYASDSIEGRPRSVKPIVMAVAAQQRRVSQVTAQFEATEEIYLGAVGISTSDASVSHDPKPGDIE